MYCMEDQVLRIVTIALSALVCLDIFFQLLPCSLEICREKLILDKFASIYIYQYLSLTIDCVG